MISSPYAHLKTGKETHKLYYCQHCGWQSKAMREQWAMPDKCGECGKPLSFLRFEMHEKAEAEEIIGSAIEVAED